MFEAHPLHSETCDEPHWLRVRWAILVPATRNRWKELIAANRTNLKLLSAALPPRRRFGRPRRRALTELAFGLQFPEVYAALCSSDAGSERVESMRTTIPVCAGSSTSLPFLAAT